MAAVPGTALRLFSGLLAAALLGGCGDHEPAHKDSPAIHMGLGPRATPEPELEQPREPKLVVMIVVDQMRFDYLERFGPQWQHGFIRLRDEGRNFASAYHEHALTETAPGHATLATGNDPARTGIVANGWFDRSSGSKVKAVDDLDVKIFGDETAKGVSSASLLREGVGDWLQAQHPEAVVVAMAVKDRAAILLGGKHPDLALWYDDAFGGYTTSSYYGDARPAWVDAYNGKDRAQALYGEQGWTLSRPDAEYGSSRRVTDPELVTTYSGFALTKRFPHVITDPAKAPRNVVRDTPFGDQMTLELAREAITAEHMGADEVPDLLLIGLSGGDYAGHRYGPNSVEMHDYYLRMDAAIGAFIDDLDARVGKGEYVVILTADHGVVPMPEYSDIEGAGRYAPAQEVPPLLEQLKLDHPPKLAFSHGINLLFDADTPEPERARVREALAELMRADARIADVWTRDELLGDEDRNGYAAAWRRSFHPERSSDLLIQFAPGVVSHPEGTGHGTPYEYDQHVPLVIRGPGWTGVEASRVSTVDVAPTIAGLVGVAVADGVDGHPLPRE